LGFVVSLDATKSKDPDGDPIGYSWIQTGGPDVTLNGADTSIATFTAPSDLPSNVPLAFKLTVTDSKNASNC
jgi:bifunctional chitinase/lysozyme